MCGRIIQGNTELRQAMIIALQKCADRYYHSNWLINNEGSNISYILKTMF